MRYVVALVTAAIALTGCSDPFYKFAKVFPDLRGQSIDALYARWGVPSQIVEPSSARWTDQFDGQVYVWNTSERLTYNTATTATGFIGTTPVTITTNTPESTTLHCSIRVKVSEQKRIVDIAVSGANGACQLFADRL